MTFEESFHCDPPDWRPLEAILPLEECGPFMYMGWLDLDGRRLHHYKHGFTRRYLFVTDELETYRYLDEDVYVPQPRSAAIRYVLEDHWWMTSASAEVPQEIKERVSRRPRRGTR